MAKKIFGLDISDRSIEALLLAKPFFGKPTIVSYARSLLAHGIVENGEIKNSEILAAAIVDLLKSADPKAIKTPYCILSIPESQVFTTIFKMPAGLKKKEILNTIPYQAEEIIPYKIDDIYFDFKSIDRYDTTQDVFYVAVPKNIVDSYVELLKKINLKPLAFDLESISLARALLNTTTKSQGKLLIDIGGRVTNFNIFDKNGIRANFEDKIAGNSLTKVISTALKIPLKEAEKIKLQSSFNPKTDQEKKVTEALKAQFKKIVAQGQKLIKFFKEETGRDIDEVILAGGSVLLDGIDQFFADQFKIKADIGSPFSKILDPKNIFKFKKSDVIFANVAGLALRAVQKDPVNGDINLLPLRPRSVTLAPEKTERKEWRAFYLQLGVFIFLVIVFFGILLAKQKYDIAGMFFPKPDYSQTNTTVDLDQLNQLRENTVNDLENPQATTTPNLVATTTAPQLISTSTQATTTPSAVGPVLNQNQKVKIKPTSLGYLNVRQGPGTTFSKVGQAEIGKTYDIISQKGDWFEIKLSDQVSGWVFSTYVEIIK